ncbi:MAG: hypothetical protein AABX93_01030 [Nanoarchaeota archaeon]
MKLTNIVRNALLISGGVSLMALSGCMGIKDKLNKICKEDYQWTEQECSTAFTEGLKMNYMLNVAEDIKDGGRKFEINYNRLSLDEILDREKSLVASYEANLDPKNKRVSNIFNNLGIRDILMEELLVREQRVKWMNFAKTLRKFMGEMGYDSNASDIDKTSYKGLAQKSIEESGVKKQSYNIRFVSPFEKLDPVELFSVAVIEAARKGGKLERVQSFRFPFYEQVQKQDPKKPDDPNAKIWQQELRGVEVVAYDVNGDVKKLPDYITVSKMNGRNENGKIIFDEPSARPSIQIFKSPGSSEPDIMVIDRDENLFPEEVTRIAGITNASDLLFSKKGETIDQLFADTISGNREEKLKGFRKGYQLPEQYFDVAVVGQTKTEEFKINESGWPLPTFRYKNEKETNYKVEIILQPPKTKDDSKEIYKRIALFKKVYHAPGNKYGEVEGNVFEYFKAPKEYAEDDVREASVIGSDNQILSIHRKGKIVEEWHIDDILKGAKPFAIEYNLGDKREAILDRNGAEESQSRYEAKKIFSQKDKDNLTPKDQYH